MENTGGRVTYDEASDVRIINGDGSVSPDVYKVKSVRSDRKGHILLHFDGRDVKVHHRRIIPVDSLGKAIVLESSGKYNALCSLCGYTEEVDAKEEFQCPNHGVQPLYWICVKPTFIKQSKPHSTRSDKIDKPKIKETATMKNKQQVDLEALSLLDDCELYTQNNVAFDHARIEVKSHILLYTGSEPRKLCFNTYDGTLGRKATELPIADFLSNQLTGKTKKWYPVKDLVKAREQMIANGYEKFIAKESK